MRAPSILMNVCDSTPDEHLSDLVQLFMPYHFISLLHTDKLFHDTYAPYRGQT